MSFFFFQAEDGIRDYKVTGVQMCALPISSCKPRPATLHQPTFSGRGLQLVQRHLLQRLCTSSCGCDNQMPHSREARLSALGILAAQQFVLFRSTPAALCDYAVAAKTLDGSGQPD